jgi:hypothetical protein
MGKPLIFDRWFGVFEEIEAIEQEDGKNITCSKGFDESIDENQNTETDQLRAQLKAHIPPKEYPVWLDGIRVQTFKPDGTLVVTFKDKLASDYARIKFSEKILKSAVGIWNEVSGLMIHEEPDHFLSHDEDKRLGIDERALAAQAAQSLIGSGFAGGGCRANALNDWIPY